MRCARTGPEWDVRKRVATNHPSSPTDQNESCEMPQSLWSDQEHDLSWWGLGGWRTPNGWYAHPARVQLQIVDWGNTKQQGLLQERPTISKKVSEHRKLIKPTKTHLRPLPKGSKEKPYLGRCGTKAENSKRGAKVVTLDHMKTFGKRPCLDDNCSAQPLLGRD